jgi:hypothetical protein
MDRRMEKDKHRNTDRQAGLQINKLTSGWIDRLTDTGIDIITKSKAGRQGV